MGRCNPFFFEDREYQLFCRSGIGRRLKGAPLIERRGDTDQDCVRFFELRENPWSR